MKVLSIGLNNKPLEHETVLFVFDRHLNPPRFVQFFLALIQT